MSERDVTARLARAAKEMGRGVTSGGDWMAFCPYGADRVRWWNLESVEEGWVVLEWEDNSQGMMECVKDTHFGEDLEAAIAHFASIVSNHGK